MGSDSALRTLTVDIGGTGIKALELDAEGRPLGDRDRELTPRPAHPEPILALIATMLARHGFDRVSVGFPGVVVRGVVMTAPNLDRDAWRGIDLRAAVSAHCGKPVRVVNDADLQGYGVIAGSGVELVLTLGTGLGSALFTDGHLCANLELGHHPFGRGKTYEQRIGDLVRKKIGKQRFRRRVDAMLCQLQPFFNPDRIYLGGGNAKLLDGAALPDNAVVFRNEEGMRGGIRLWQDAGVDVHGSSWHSAHRRT